MRVAMLLVSAVVVWIGSSGLASGQSSVAGMMLGPMSSLASASSARVPAKAEFGESLCHYNLWFQPQTGMELLVKFEDLQKVSGKKPSERRFEAEVAWTFEAAGKQSWAATGRCLSARLVETTGKGEAATSRELAWSLEKGLTKTSQSKAGRHFAQELSAVFRAKIDRQGRVTAEKDDLFFARGQLIHASRFGFSAHIAGRRIVPSATWTSKGDLLARAGVSTETARFRVEKVTRENGRRIAHVKGEIRGPVEGRGARGPVVCKQMLRFDLGQKFSTRSSLAITSPQGQRKVLTRASWRKIRKQPAQLASIRSLPLGPLH